MRAVEPSRETPAPLRRHWGKRHRRIAWTGGILATAAVIGGLLSWKAYRESRPEEYVPGEASAEITASIAEKGSHEGAGRQAAPRMEVRSRKPDPLRDPGRALPPGAPPPRFTDVTAAAGLSGFRTFAGRRSSQLPEDMGGGVAWGDFDNDGYDDLFVVSAGGTLGLPADQRAPSMLFRNRGDGTFERAQSFPDLRILGMGAAWGDYNNDGWLDLVVTGFNTLLLFRNDHGVLKRDTNFPSPEGFWTGASWGDYDRDGRLDLYVCGYVRYAFDERKSATTSQQFGLEVPYTLNPASFESERNLLFHNLGNGRFEEVAKALGVQNPEGRSLSALWHDFDGDGWPDLYVANDISENKFLLNRRGKFADAGHGAWIAEYRGSMGLAAGDFDRDGDDDLFISHWVAQQFALYESLAADNRKNGLGANAALRFTDVAEATGIGPPSFQKIGWGAAFADFDSDGWLDLAVANGSTFETKDARKQLVPMKSFLFWNARGRFFHDLAPWNRSLGSAHVSRGLAVADYDNDGALDVAIVDLDGGVRLLRNDLPHGNWIEFRLRDRGVRGAGGFADGAVVTVWAGGKAMRTTVSSASYLSQNSRRVHFGLGAAATADKVEVRWPDARTQSWASLEANRIWDLTENETLASRFPDPAVPSASPLSREQTVRFWQVQRAAMDAMKRSNDPERAASLFREALALNPAHEDSRYYLANCLATRGDPRGAIVELQRLASINPHSHRAWQRQGVLLAGMGSFAAARSALERAHGINPEESGTLLLLAEVDLAQRDFNAAERHLDLALRMNPKSVGGLFLSAYTAWKRRAEPEARKRLAAAHAVRGPDWKPEGSTAEGDVKAKRFSEAGFLAHYWERWNGAVDPRSAFAEIDARLSRTGNQQ